MPGPGGQQSGGGNSLGKVLTAVASAMAEPDADLQFLTKLQMAIIQQLKGGAAGGGAPGMGGPPPGAGPAGPPPGGPPGGGTGMPPPPMTGGNMGMAGMGPPPNPDELRRVLGATGVSK